MKLSLGIAVMALVTCATARGADSKASGPLSPEKALAAIVTEPGLRLELIAAEPLVADPVAIAWDEKGRLFVAENRGYPTGPGEGKPPAGVIAMLEDTNRDGRMDRRTEFATGLQYPNGLMPWRGGWFITDAPDILYLKDTDGDGVADIRKVVLTGFMTNSTTQLRVSHPTLGLDGWVYLTSGLTGGTVTSPEHPDRPAVKFAKSDSRFHPDTFEFEAEPGQGQFGLAFDDFGRRFICSNRNPLQHVVLHPRYLKRNPHLAFSETVQDVAPAGDAAKVWPLSEDHTTAAFIPGLMSTPHAGTFTAACGISIYRGGALPMEMYGNAFICEPAQNLIQRQVIEPDGPTFKSRPATPGRESVASADTWFRPVFTANGPDGAIYICDMYRKIIDHPQYLPEHIRGSLDYDAGKGMGRVYRIKGANLKSPISNLKSQMGSASTKELVAALNAENGWTRDTAFRLLLEKRDKAAVAGLKSLVSNSKSAKPTARVAALRLLDKLDALDDESLNKAMTDAHHAPLRENALQVIEGRKDLPQPLLLNASGRIGDRAPRVRFQAALNVGANTDHGGLLAYLLIQDGTNKWTRAAVLSGVGNQPNAFWDRLIWTIEEAARLNQGPVSKEAMHDVGHLLAASLNPVDLESALNKGLAARGASHPSQAAFVTGIANGARSRGLAKGGQSALMSLVAGETPEAKEAAARLEELFQRARQIAVNADIPTTERVAAIELLAHGDYARSGEALQGLLNLQTPAEVQAAAVRALAQMPGDTVAAGLVRKWRAYTPSVRDAVLNAILAQPRFIPALLEAVAEGVVQPWAIPANRRASLLKHKDNAIRELAEKAFAGLQSGDRIKVYEEYKPVLQMKGDPASGRAVYERACASCHRYNDLGAQVGPDLSGVRNQPADALLLHILVPDAEIYPGFTSYDVETADGRSLTGLIVSETPSSITLRRALGEEETVLRSQIVSISSTGLSLMPQELEKGMTKQELADLISFLKGERISP